MLALQLPPQRFAKDTVLIMEGTLVPPATTQNYVLQRAS